MKNQCGQNATHIEETLQRAQNVTPVEETRRKRSNATPVEETVQSAQNATPVVETLQSAEMRPLSRKRQRGVQKTIPVNEIALQSSEYDHCRINCIWAVRMQNTKEIALRMYMGLVTTNLYAKY